MQNAVRLDWYKVLPKGYQAMLTLQKVVDESKIEHKLLELVKIRASQINRCAHCIDMHTKDAIALGENQQRIYLLSAWREAPFYSLKERTALAWCEALTYMKNNNAVEEAYDEIENLFSPEEIVELSIAIVAINGWNRLAVGFRSEVGNYESDKQLILNDDAK